MLSRIIAAGGLGLAALIAPPAQADPVGHALTAQSGGAHVQRVFHEAPYRPLYAPRVYVQPRYEAPILLAPDEIEDLLRSSGYSRIEIVALDGPIYTVQGVDPWDNYVEMKVFGQDGRVLRSDVVEVRLYDTPFAERPPMAIPDEEPRIVGAVPQAPAPLASRTEPRIASAPLPRSRPAYTPEPSLPDVEAASPIEEPRGPVAQADEPEPQSGDRDPLVVY